MKKTFWRVVLAAALACSAQPSSAQDLQKYLDQYFKGSMIGFAYGTGVSSNLPRVELVIHYCASGLFFSAGRSCRPNVIAQGFQCTQLRDAGKWRLVVQGRQAALQWMSNSGAPGSVMLGVWNDGVVVDPRGNPFNRLGPAQCG